MNYLGILENITDLASDLLNEWEIGFVNSVLELIEKDIELSDKQKLTILKIQDKYLKY